MPSFSPSSSSPQPAPCAFAHTLPDHPPGDWEPLEEHLAQVAALSAHFASAFGATAWGERIGRCHDLGKYSAAFQQYLLSSADPDAGAAEGKKGRVDHSTFGARHLDQLIGGHKGKILAFCVAGHHAGLADATADDESRLRSTLQFRLDPALRQIPPVTLPAPIPAGEPLSLPFRPDPRDGGFQVAFFTRMLFSCLIDADRLATGQFCQPDESRERALPRPSIPELNSALAAHLQQLQAARPATRVNEARARVLHDCLAAAPLAPGFFSLNVPTGGGKTLSSLAFALDHAIRHGLRRVVVALPFTSIIEQTADVFRRALGDLAGLALLEHHSNIDPKRDTRANQLAAENWDAPLIVTTNVQLYESLFSSRTGSCRKLHRLANSVIILDEAQTIPVDLLQPTLAALRELVLHYGCSIVLCTATQPAIEHRDDFPIGLQHVRPITRDVPALFLALKRVECIHAGKLTDEDLAQRLAAQPAALCIVNTRPHAARLFSLLTDTAGLEGCFHLSTFMCGQHRRDTLHEIRQRLAAGLACRVVSTQLVEAGVDVDFPVVYRAPAGFDSIAQAAGRCNREGRLHCGQVYLFNTESRPPAGLLCASAHTACELFSQFPDPLAPEAMEAYFRLLYWSRQHEWDKYEVMRALNPSLRDPVLALQFETAASGYRIIREEQEQLLVPYDQRARHWRDQLYRQQVEFIPPRAAQPYLVALRTPLLRALQQRNLVHEHESGLWLLMNETAYSSTKGLSLESHGFDSELLIV